VAAGEAGDSDQSDPGTAGRIIAAERARGPAFDGVMDYCGEVARRESRMQQSRLERISACLTIGLR